MGTGALGIDKSMAAIADFSKFGLDTAAIVKLLIANPTSVPAYLKIIPAIGDLIATIRDVVAAMPELKDLDAAESTQLLAAFYSACRDIVSAALGMSLADKMLPSIEGIDVAVASKMTAEFYEDIKKLVTHKPA